jgi:hypothetical protein
LKYWVARLHYRRCLAGLWPPARNRQGRPPGAVDLDRWPRSSHQSACLLQAPLGLRQTLDRELGQRSIVTIAESTLGATLRLSASLCLIYWARGRPRERSHYFVSMVSFRVAYLTGPSSRHWKWWRKTNERSANDSAYDYQTSDYLLWRRVESTIGALIRSWFRSRGF